MKPLLVSCLCTLLATFCQAEENDGWIDLFDGRTLDGWTRHGGEATFTVQDGTIIGSNGPGHNTFLCTDQTYADFELELEVRIEGELNSGIQIRSKVRDEALDGRSIERVYGPQIEVEPSPGESGYVYGERAGGWLTPDADRISHDTFRNNEWNRYRIVAKGPRIETWINGRQVSDLASADAYRDHASGFIGLQVHRTDHPTGTLRVHWRNLRIREITTDGWISLFDGATLDGWTPKIAGYPLGENPGRIFRVEDGVLKATHRDFGAFRGAFGHLFYQTPFSTYRLRLEYRAVGGREHQAAGAPAWAYRNNGIMIHGQTAASMALDQQFPVSLEVQLLGADDTQPDRTTANLCTPGTQAYRDGELLGPKCLPSASASYAGDQWVRVEVQVSSSEIIHFVNGHEVLRYQQPELDDGTPLTSGTLSLQAESHDFEFRDIEIHPL